MRAKAKTYAVIPCDIIGSRHIEEFRRKRDKKLHHIQDLLMRKDANQMARNGTAVLPGSALRRLLRVRIKLGCGDLRMFAS
jgi:hypothetical protein